MSLPIKFFCFLLVAGFIGLFVLKKPDGTPWLSVHDLLPSVSIDEVTEGIKDVVPDQIVGGDSDSVEVYRWKDAEGNWQYSDTPPEGGTAEQVMVSTDVNRDLVPKLESRPAPIENKKGKAILIGDSAVGPTTAFQPDKVSELIEEAKGVQEIMDQRQQQLDEALGR